MTRATKEQQAAMVDAYQSGLTAREAGTLFGFSQRASLYALKKAGLCPRNASEAHRVHSLNEHYFATIDTPEKAYWLGFLAADGNVRDGSVCVSSEQKDYGHLEKFRLTIGHTGEVRTYAHKAGDGSVSAGKTTTMSVFQVYSRVMAGHLTGHGVTPRKSLTLKPWVSSTLTLQASYWAGVVDGDGCIRVFVLRNGLAATCSVGLCGTEAVVRGFADFVYANTASVHRRGQKKIFHLSEGHFTTQFGGVNVCKQIVTLLYGSSGVWLDRKKAIADQILALPSLRRDRALESRLL